MDNTEGVFEGQVYKFPHCDSRVLHAPGKCQYCDHFPKAQQERIAGNVNFTGEGDLGKFPCPAEQARSLTHIERWSGNRAYREADDILAAPNDEGFYFAGPFKERVFGADVEVRMYASRSPEMTGVVVGFARVDMHVLLRSGERAAVERMFRAVRAARIDAMANLIIREQGSR